MFVFKLSWAPWILIVAGILVAMDDPTGLVLTVAGIIWLVLKARKKKGATKSSVSPSFTKAKKSNATKMQQTNTSKAVMNYCPHCGKPVQSDFAFCTDCGSKLNIT